MMACLFIVIWPLVKWLGQGRGEDGKYRESDTVIHAVFFPGYAYGDGFLVMYTSIS